MLTHSGASESPFPKGAIDHGALLFEALRDIAKGLDHRARSILRSELAFEPESIHALRLATKRLRAYWQLTKRVTDRGTASHANQGLRDAARTLAESRDEHVLRTLLLEIATSSHRIPAKEVKRAAALIPSVRVLREKDRRRFLDAIERDAVSWSDLSDVSDRTLIEVGMARCFDKTRRLGVEALREQEPEALHRWRRWVKYLRYQLEPFARPEHELTEAFHAELDTMGSTLGARNDLNNLRRAIRVEKLPALAEAIESRDAALAASLPPLSETPLGLEPGEFASRVCADLGV